MVFLLSVSHKALVIHNALWDYTQSQADTERDYKKSRENKRGVQGSVLDQIVGTQNKDSKT